MRAPRVSLEDMDLPHSPIIGYDRIRRVVGGFIWEKDVYRSEGVRTSHIFPHKTRLDMGRPASDQIQRRLTSFRIVLREGWLGHIILCCEIDPEEEEKEGNEQNSEKYYRCGHQSETRSAHEDR